MDADGKPIPHKRVAAVNPDAGEKVIPNPNSGLIWDFTKRSENFEDAMYRSISNVTIHDNLVIAACAAGFVHCLDAKTGEKYWTHEMWGGIWGSPLIVDGLVYVGDEDGDVEILRLSSHPDVAMKKVDGEYQPIAKIYMGGSVYSSPIFANNALYIATRNSLHAIETKQTPQDVSETRAGGNWPQWRGPQRTNVSTETDLLKQWPAGGPPLLWQAEGLGEGVSSVSIAGGRIYTLGYRDGNEYAIALDEKNGTKIWDARIGPAVKEAGIMRWLNQRTPTVDSDRLYVVTTSGELICLETAGGVEIWRKSYTVDFEGNKARYGYCDFPLIDGEKLICTPGGPTATMVALNKRTGEVIWKSAVPGENRTAYSTTVVAEVGGIRQYLNYLYHGLVGVAATDGRFLWRYDANADRFGNVYTPIVRGDLVFSPVSFGARPHGSALLKLLPVGNGIKVEEQYLGYFYV